MKYMDVKKRGWVKNVAIVFLAVMLVLTFFSNTIRNRSLPEVAAQYTTSGTITARIRGNGVVSANESYEVKTTQSRIVSERLVKVNDHVSIGDVLIRFKGTESPELETARLQLRAEERKLEEMLLRMSEGSSTLASAARAVTDAKNALNDALATLEAIHYNEDAYNAALSADNHAQVVLASASATATARQFDLTIADSELQTLKDRENTGSVVDPNVMAAARQKVSIATDAYRRAQIAQDSANDTVNIRKIDLDAAEQKLKVLESDFAADPPTATIEEVNAARLVRNAASDAYTRALASLSSAAATAATRKYDLDIAELDLKILTDREDIGTVVNPGVMEAAIRKRNAADEANRLAQAALTLANADATITSATLSIHQKEKDAILPANLAVRQAQLNLDDANANLSLLKTSESITSSIKDIELRELLIDIEDIKKLIDELEKEGTGSEITALVSGIVTHIHGNVAPGLQVSPEDILMNIEVVDRGYSLSFAVTPEQASRLSIGDVGEVDRGWYWRDELRATLIGIRNDPQNPVTSRLLHFAISGDGQIESGSQLFITINQRSENHNIIVPNNAVRTDTNGTFVLVVISTSGPLGNRYIATRADVTVLASDDTHTAVTGALSGWDFVITHSNDPINPGMEVRLVDNPW